MATHDDQPSTRVRRGDPKYTWDDTIAAIGKDYSGGKILVADEKVEAASLARYCEVFEFSNPIYWDAEVAKRAGYRDQVAPWASVKDTFSYGGSWRPGEPTRYPLNMGKDDRAETASRAPSEGDPPMPPTTSGFFTDMTIEFFEPVCLGDNITIMGRKLASVTPKETRVGVGAFLSFSSEYFNQRGELVARATQGTFAYNRKPKQ
jgi:hypothetical protein